MKRFCFMAALVIVMLEVGCFRSARCPEVQTPNIAVSSINLHSESEEKAPFPQCSECLNQGKPYRVWEAYRTRTAMAGSPGYWDQDGKWHEGWDPNFDTVHYRCSNDHSWSAEQ